MSSEAQSRSLVGDEEGRVSSSDKDLHSPQLKCPGACSCQWGGLEALNSSLKRGILWVGCSEEELIFSQFADSWKGMLENQRGWRKGS